MKRISFIQVGTTMELKRDVLSVEKGDVGVCYEIYNIGGREGYSFIFENGRYDGFSPDEVEAFFDISTNSFVPEVSNYNFQNVIRLSNDFRKGYFDCVWN